jgi:MFS family permease
MVKNPASPDPMAADQSQQAGPRLRSTTWVWHLVLAGMTASVLVAYLPRTALGPAASLIKDELRLSDVVMGEVLGVWALGYVFLQLPGGWLGDRFGRRVMMSLYGLIWSACTFMTAAAASFTGLWWSRLIFGMAQGGLIPCLTRACVDWFPEDRRGTASAAINAGMSAGAVAAGGLSAVLLPWLGWRLTLQLLALVGVVWAIGFWTTFRDRPEQHPWVNQAEVALIRKPAVRFDPTVDHSLADSIDPPPQPAVKAHAAAGADRLGVYGSRAFVLLNSQAFCRAYGYAFLTSWLPSYLERAHGVGVARASALSTLPLAGYIAGSIVGGPLIDGLFRRTGSKRVSRSMVGASSLVLTGLGMAAAIFAAYPWALAALVVGITFSGFAGPATWAATMDVGGKSSTSVMAILNMSGNLGAYLCPKAIGWILQTRAERWDLVLLMLTMVYIAGGLCWLAVDPQARMSSESHGVESR